MVQLRLLLFSKRHRFVLDPLLLISVLVQKYYKTPPSPKKKGLYVNLVKKTYKESKMKNYNVLHYLSKAKNRFNILEISVTKLPHIFESK